jgi:hypothetical protein
MRFYGAPRHWRDSGGGLVIDIVYAVDPWTSHGNGVGKDNKGGRYRLQVPAKRLREKKFFSAQPAPRGPPPQ